jgi:hypothetical protein
MTPLERRCRAVAHKTRLALLLFVATACTSSPSSPDASTSDAGDAAAFVNCALTEPVVGVPCSMPGYTCEYGDDSNSACNQLRICETYGSETKWVRNVPAPAGVCPTSPQPSPNCPSTFPSGDCSALDGGATCEYAQGFCVCNVNDSGIDWRCDDQLDCPQPRPRLGTPCASEGQTCSYLACFVPWGATITCKAGIWNPVTLCE